MIYKLTVTSALATLVATVGPPKNSPLTLLLYQSHYLKRKTNRAYTKFNYLTFHS